MNTTLLATTLAQKLNQTKSDLSRRFDAQVENTLARFIGWAFSKRAVQRAIADKINCQTPIGRMLNDHIESTHREIDADDIDGLDQYIERAVESALDNLEIKAEQVSDLAEAIQATMEECTPEVTRVVCQEIIDKLS